MITGRIRQGALALLAGAAVTAAPVVFLLAPASAAGAAVTVPSCRLYTDPLDADVLIGEVQNVGTSATGPVAIDVTWLDAAGAPIGTPDTGITSAILQTIPAGPASASTNRSPFRALVTPPAGAVGCRIDATTSDPLGEPNHNYTVTLSSKPSDAADSNGFRHIKGSVTNNNTTASDDVTIVVTLYDAAGKVVDDAVGSPASGTTVAPGAVTSFDLPSEGSGQSYARASAIVESSTPPSAAPADSASPSASAATPSPAASASDTPTESPSSPTPSATSSAPTPTVTATPDPCRAGGGTIQIATTPSIVKVAKGGRVRLTSTVSQAGRICQAGVRLSVYVRGPGTTLFHVSRSATTSSVGKAVFDYTGVRADFRWYVLSSGVRSATNLVQAR